MRRVTPVALLVVALGLAPAAGAQQKKHKDEVLHQYLIDEFAQLNAKFDKLTERLAALEAELGRAKQQQADLTTELRNSQNVVKAMDTSLSSFRLSSQQDLFSLRTELAALRQEMTRVIELLTKSAPAPAATPQPAPAGPSPEGYITAVTDTDVVINLGSAAGITPGAKLNVFKASDPQTPVGTIEVTEVTAPNNSRAKITSSRPSVRFEFSDIVRLAR
jgi:hypothetical protein